MTYTSLIFPPKIQCVAQVHTLILISFRFCDPDNAITMYPQLPTSRVTLHAGPETDFCFTFPMGGTQLGLTDPLHPSPPEEHIQSSCYPSRFLICAVGYLSNT